MPAEEAAEGHCRQAAGGGDCQVAAYHKMWWFEGFALGETRASSQHRCESMVPAVMLSQERSACWTAAPGQAGSGGGTADG